MNHPAQITPTALTTPALSRSDCRALAQFGVFPAANDTETTPQTVGADLPSTLGCDSP